VNSAAENEHQLYDVSE